MIVFFRVPAFKKKSFLSYLNCRNKKKNLNKSFSHFSPPRLSVLQNILKNDLPIIFQLLDVVLLSLEKLYNIKCFQQKLHLYLFPSTSFCCCLRKVFLLSRVALEWRQHYKKWNECNLCWDIITESDALHARSESFVVSAIIKGASTSVYFNERVIEKTRQFFMHMIHTRLVFDAVAK